MSRLKRCTGGLITAAILLLPTVLVADEDPPRVVLMDGDEQITISLDGSELEVVCDEDGETSVHIVDLAAVGELAGEALEGLDEALAELEDLQFGVHVGVDNNLQFSHGEETWELDMSEIMSQLAEALQDGLDEIDTEDWTSTRERDRTTEELREELRELKKEMRRLRRELAEQNDDD